MPAKRQRHPKPPADAIIMREGKEVYAMHGRHAYSLHPTRGWRRRATERPKHEKPRQLNILATLFQKLGEKKGFV